MINYDLITRRAAGLKQRYGTAGPREILEDCGVAVLDLPMGTGEDAIKGFILKSSRMITVGVNADLSAGVRDKVLFHELGHYDLGHLSRFRSGSLRDTSFAYRPDASVLSKLENEANFYASDYLLDTDETLEAVHAYDLASAARVLRVPVEFLDYKLRLLYHTGKLDRYRDFFSVRSDCMKTITDADP